ncbi:GNAT family N-acetyltransferase [Frigoribacterium sp. 2-23]|uniref:GNAT family N-acetyltransferase n=1 Tax=Frigoribacterium sp. 2-23 TaxID=3415006 RepID=UPI003C6FBFC8
MQLVSPSKRFFASFQQSLVEWQGAHQDGAGIRDAGVLTTKVGFSRWVEQLQAEEATPRGQGFVTCTYYWMVEEDEYLGSIALRHELNDVVGEFVGHVGYSVRPSARGRGIAGRALRSMLVVARDRGFERVLLTCDALNVASRRVIERCGGEWENSVTDGGGNRIERFWMTPPSGGPSAR